LSRLVSSYLILTVIKYYSGLSPRLDAVLYFFRGHWNWNGVGRDVSFFCECTVSALAIRKL